MTDPTALEEPRRAEAPKPSSAAAALEKLFASSRQPQSVEDADAGRAEIRFGVIALVVFFLGFGGWAALTPLDAAVSAPGVVVVSGNRQTVQHREGGIVSALHAQEGQRVEQGAILIELASTELRSQERALMGRAIELAATRARLLAEMDGRRTLERPPEWQDLPSAYAAQADSVFARQQREMNTRRAAVGAQQEVLSQRREQLNSRIQGYEDQIAALDRQSLLIQDELAGVRRLAERGLVPLPRVRALERTQAEIDGRRAELSALIEQSREGIGESRMQGIAINEGRQEDSAAQLREVDTQLAELMPRVDAVRAELERTLIRAPATGQIVGLQVHTVGGVIRPGEALMDVVPEAQPLVLEARVSPQEADDLQVGMRTEVRFVSVTGGQLPILFGEVSRVSADRFTDERSGTPYFLAEVIVPNEEMTRLEAGLPGAAQIRAGLPVEVVVPLRARTALQYVLEPLNRQLWRSFREH